MMKKTIYVATTVGVLAFGGIVYANTDSTVNDASNAPASNQNSAENLMSFEEISEKALEVADGKITDIELDANRNSPHYEVDVLHDGYEYDLKLDAVTGEVLNENREKENGDDDSEKTLDSADLISSDEAVKAALAIAGGKVEDISLENEDGVATYEIELKDGKTEHEVAVNATDGSIIEHESDNDNDDDDDDDN